MTSVGSAGSPNQYYTETVTVSQSVNATNGQTIPILAVQNGWQIHNVVLATAGCGTSVTMSVGDTNVAARYISAQSVASAGYVQMGATPTQSSNLPANGPGFTYTANDTIQITVGGANFSAATVVVVTVTFSRTFGNT